MRLSLKRDRKRSNLVKVRNSASRIFGTRPRLTHDDYRALSRAASMNFPLHVRETLDRSTDRKNKEG